VDDREKRTLVALAKMVDQYLCRDGALDSGAMADNKATGRRRATRRRRGCAVPPPPRGLLRYVNCDTDYDDIDCDAGCGGLPSDL
jgi:hypothetical protein